MRKQDANEQLAIALFRARLIIKEYLEPAAEAFKKYNEKARRK